MTGCRLEEVEIYFREGKKSCLKSIIEEMRYQIRVSLYRYSWRCCAEKTVQMNGCGKSGFYFRNIMKRRLRTPRQGFLRHTIMVREDTTASAFITGNLDYKKYDEMFYHTVAEDTEETAVELALDRLRFPEELSEKNKNVYKTYIREHMETVAAYLVKREDIEGIRFLEQKKLWSEPSLQKGMDVAAERNRTESLSVLMDVRKELFPKKKKTFEL